MQRTQTPLTTEQTFGRAVNGTRSSKGWSQRELAERLSSAGIEVDASAVSRIEKGTRALRLSEAVVIAKVLGQSLPAMLSPYNDDHHVSALYEAVWAHEQALVDLNNNLLAYKGWHSMLSEAVADAKRALKNQDVQGRAATRLESLISAVEPWTRMTWQEALAEVQQSALVKLSGQGEETG